MLEAQGALLELAVDDQDMASERWFVLVGVAAVDRADRPGDPERGDVPGVDEEVSLPGSGVVAQEPGDQAHGPG